MTSIAMPTGGQFDWTMSPGDMEPKSLQNAQMYGQMADMTVPVSQIMSPMRGALPGPGGLMGGLPGAPGFMQALVKPPGSGQLAQAQPMPQQQAVGLPPLNAQPQMGYAALAAGLPMRMG